MARLPQPGGDNGDWGDILNDYLDQAHNNDGTLKDDSVGSSQLQDNSVTGSHIQDNSVPQSKITNLTTDLSNKVDSGSLDSLTAALVSNNASATGTALDGTYATQSDAAAKTNFTDFTSVGWSVAQAADDAAARAAIGAAAATSSSSKTLVAGDNVTFSEDASTVTVTSAWGGPHTETISLDNCNDLTVSTGTGNLRLVFFTQQKTGTYSSLKFFSGSTAAGATPTTIRIGIYSVDASDNITLIASTANDTALLASTTTVYTENLTASVSLTAGGRYAVGLLVITAATAPTLYGHAMGSSTVAGIGPGRRTALVAGQTTLLGSILNTSFSISNAAIWFRFS
jgi:hypothetical protein